MSPEHLAGLEQDKQIVLDLNNPETPVAIQLIPCRDAGCQDEMEVLVTTPSGSVTLDIDDVKRALGKCVARQRNELRY